MGVQRSSRFDRIVAKIDRIVGKALLFADADNEPAPFRVTARQWAPVAASRSADAPRTVRAAKQTDRG